MSGLEVVVASDGAQDLEEAVISAAEAGASTIELCRAMEFEGLSPTEEQVRRAAEALPRPCRLMVMVRPRGAGFHYDDAVVREMEREIERAGRLGVDGVVFGALDAGEAALDGAATRALIARAKDAGLKCTLHRAFDVLPDPLGALDAAVAFGFDRILTSGSPWGSQPEPWRARESLAALIAAAQGNIEVVIGGGINLEIATALMEFLNPENRPDLFHAHGAAHSEGRVDPEKIRRLVAAVS